jgi:hypothetical protein
MPCLDPYNDRVESWIIDVSTVLSATKLGAFNIAFAAAHESAAVARHFTYRSAASYLLLKQ